MSDIAASSSSFVRQELVPERPAGQDHGRCGFLRTRLSIANQHPDHHFELLLLGSPSFRRSNSWWSMRVDRHRPQCVSWRECRASGRRVLAVCRGEIQPVMYGFYPESERWRVNLT